MGEKVIFEYRANESEGGFEIRFNSGSGGCAVFGPTIWGCCTTLDAPRSRGKKQSRHKRQFKEKSRRRMRDTLDFLERMYGDLYGGEESSEKEPPEID
jgi:hypothetical protein